MNEFVNVCKNGNIDDVKQLLSVIDPSIKNNYAIRWAAENGHKDVVELLLKDPRVDPNNSVIRWAARNVHKDIIELLEQHSYKIDNVRYNEMAKLK